MYLYMLSTEQKDLFLNLCISLSKIDGVFAKEEEKLLRDLCDEMKIDYRNEIKLSIDESINNLNSICDKRTKRMLILELIGMVFVDGVVDDGEIEFVKMVIRKFELDIKEFDEAYELVRQLYLVYEQMHRYVER